MFFSAQSYRAVDVVIAPFRTDAAPEPVRAGLASLSATELRAAVDYARANGVLPALADRLEAMGALGVLPPDPRGVLERALADGAALERRERAERAEVLAVLAAAGVDYIALKGAYFTHALYPRPGTRPTRDLDLLVGQGDLARVRTLLEGIGFSVLPNTDEPDHHLPRLIRPRPDAPLPFSIDVHHRLVPGEVYGIAVGELADVWARRIHVDVRLVPAQETRLSTLNHHDHVLHMHVHLFHHLFYNFRLMHLLDIVRALRAWTELDRLALAAELDRLGLRAFRVDLWRWIEARFGDPIASAAASDRGEDVGRWLFRHGSLPIFAALRYANRPAEWLGASTHELRRYLYRSRRAPGWSYLSWGRA